MDETSYFFLKVSHASDYKKATRISTNGTPLAAIVVQTASALQKHCNCFVCSKNNL